jgi:uncharacterized SAM-binding protein YcdF (DUF218 family)
MRRAWRNAFLTTALLLVTCAFATVLVTSQTGAGLLVYLLEWQSRPARPEVVRAKADAIAVLGGRTARIHYGARLHLATGVPLLLVGKGTGDSGFEAESEKMEDILLRDYGIGPRWVETESLTTRENGLFAACLVGAMGVRRVALVTDPQHMPRARLRFEAAGFTVIPAPTPDWKPPRPALTWAGLVPSRAGIAAARRPLHEWAAIAMAAAPFEAMFDPPRACPYQSALH